MEKVQWITTSDERVDEEICAPADGEIVGLNEEFSTGTKQGPAHPNCRCDTVPIVE